MTTQRTAVEQTNSYTVTINQICAFATGFTQALHLAYPLVSLTETAKPHDQFYICTCSKN